MLHGGWKEPRGYRDDGFTTLPPVVMKPVHLNYRNENLLDRGQPRLLYRNVRVILPAVSRRSIFVPPQPMALEKIYVRFLSHKRHTFTRIASSNLLAYVLRTRKPRTVRCIASKAGTPYCAHERSSRRVRARQRAMKPRTAHCMLLVARWCSAHQAA